jgi:hypothetical protein
MKTLDLSLPYTTRRGVPVRKLTLSQYYLPDLSGFDPKRTRIVGEIRSRYYKPNIPGNVAAYSWHVMEWYPDGRLRRDREHGSDLVLDSAAYLKTPGANQYKWHGVDWGKEDDLTSIWIIACPSMKPIRSTDQGKTWEAMETGDPVDNGWYGVKWIMAHTTKGSGERYYAKLRDHVTQARNGWVAPDPVFDRSLLQRWRAAHPETAELWKKFERYCVSDATHKWMECPAKPTMPDFGADTPNWHATTQHPKPEEKMLNLTNKYRTRDGRGVTGLHKSDVDHNKIEGQIDGVFGNRTWHHDGKHLLHKKWDLMPACAPIELSKKYVTCVGEAVELFTIADGRAWGRYKHGTLASPDGREWLQFEWRSHSWDVNDHPLVEVKTKHKRVYWLVHRRDVWDGSKGGRQASAFISREAAHLAATSPSSMSSRNPVVAITGPHEFEFVEGDGLK